MTQKFMLYWAQSIGRDNWLYAAFDAVVEGRFDKVPLRMRMRADTLGVTRGSFYWHFSDHADLLAALQARWRQRKIDESLALRGHALSRRNDGLRRVRCEPALRGMGRRDAGVAQRLAKGTAARMAQFKAKVLRRSRDGQAATELAALSLLMITGSLHALSRPTRQVAAARVADFVRGVVADYLNKRQAVAATADPMAR